MRLGWPAGSWRYIGAQSAKKPRTMGLELAGDLHGEAGEVTIMLRVVVTSMIGVFREASKKHVEFAGRRNLGEVAKL